MREFDGDNRLAKELRGFGLVGLLAFALISAGNLIVVPLSALLVLAWVKLSRTPWREIGFVRPRSWAADLLIGIVIGIALKILLKMIVMPLLGAPSTNQAYHYLEGNRAALPGFLFTVIVGAGFGEETVFRGYLFERLGKITSVKAVIVVLTAAWFGLAHYYEQGLPGAEQATLVGLVLGSIRASTGRIWTAMAAHAAFDLTALAIIYWHLEAAVAKFVFK